MSGKDLCNWLATIAAIVMGAGAIAAMVQQHDERIANEAKMEQRVEALEWAVWSHSADFRPQGHNHRSLKCF